jgi:hypothetical protein
MRFIERLENGINLYVQVKSRATQATLNSCLATFAHNGLYDRFFFICHQPQGTLQLAANDRHHLWLSDTIADHVIELGLVNWLAERVA